MGGYIPSPGAPGGWVTAHLGGEWEGQCRALRGLVVVVEDRQCVQEPRGALAGEPDDEGAVFLEGGGDDVARPQEGDTGFHVLHAAKGRRAHFDEGLPQGHVGPAQGHICTALG